MLIAINEPELTLYGELKPPINLARILRKLESHAIEKTLAALGGNRKQAAHVLGIGRTGLYERIRKIKNHERADNGWKLIIEG